MTLSRENEKGSVCLILFACLFALIFSCSFKLKLCRICHYQTKILDSIVNQAKSSNILAPLCTEPYNLLILINHWIVLVVVVV
jgi:hypothetical protein